eukprot:GHVU01108537.1.p2 GENE.GHVU01108537.1~~GHVU01108537.1.p2  ORF type:complete len:100 (-),score=17.72 GHVU01108537.1:352-651(-)
MELPRTGGELYQFLQAASWVRAFIPNFDQEVSTLVSVLERVKCQVALQPREHRAVSRTPLTEEVGWNQEAQQEFWELQQKIVERMMMLEQEVLSQGNHS